MTYRRVPGLFKRCKHLNWDSCGCAWWGRYGKDGARVSLPKWMGERTLNKTEAIRALNVLRAQVDEGTFSVHGRTEEIAITRKGRQPSMVADLLERYTVEHIEAHHLRGTGLGPTLRVLGEGLGDYTVNHLERHPGLIESWVHTQQELRGWSSTTFNRYHEAGRAFFNWCVRKGHATLNPFLAVDRQKGSRRRRTELTSDQEGDLVRALMALPRPQRDEMRRRLFVALDCGLRAGEMLKVQLKHVHFGPPTEPWGISLPAEITKAGEDQLVYVGSARLKRELEKRRFLEPDDYVFGTQDGEYVASFDKSWHRLFTAAKLPVGRKDGLVWHDLRHEYCNRIAERTDNIATIQDMMRHADIRTSQRYMKGRAARMKEIASKLGGPS